MRKGQPIFQNLHVQLPAAFLFEGPTNPTRPFVFFSGSRRRGQNTFDGMDDAYQLDPSIKQGFQEPLLGQLDHSKYTPEN